MAAEVPLAMGAEVSCADGRCGRLSRVVVDPVARAVTHVVVEPGHWQGLGRLVPLDLVDATSGGVRLRCSLAEFERLDLAEETQFIPEAVGYGPYAPADVLAWPYYGLGGYVMGSPMAGGIPPTVSYDAVPLGEVEVRRGDHVMATDGSIGHVQGLVMDQRSRHVTHVLLREGHAWGRRDVAIPIGAVTAVDADGIRLNITRQDVGDLPPVDVGHPS